MTMQDRVPTEYETADGATSVAEIIALRKASWPDGRIDVEEAEALFEHNDDLRDSSREWTDFFVEAITTHILANSAPKGYVGTEQADWLIAQIDRESGVESMGELELLEKLFEQAENVPETLRTYALAQLEQVVLTGEGPTRDGGALDPGSINDTECRLLRRFVFAPGGDRPAAVSKAEAELLFRIKDATLSQANATDWKTLFVQGVGNYLQGFAGHEQLSQERAAELETFMNDAAVNIGRFFARMAKSSISDGATALNQPDASYLDFDEAAQKAAEVTSEEQQWLQAKLDGDHQLDELEQALLDFLAEEA
jgi:hypothetical protein